MQYLCAVICVKLENNHDFLIKFSRVCFLLFEGVSCDACMKGSFVGNRFKCLICYDYDLCSNCYYAGVQTAQHSSDHPMQCILTRSDYGMLLTFAINPSI